MRRRQLHLVVDPVACDGYGSCVELFPEWIEPDEWGYPIIRKEAIPDGLLGHAEAAVSGCPKLALSMRAERQS
jgi:ferredoxin